MHGNAAEKLQAEKQARKNEKNEQRALLPCLVPGSLRSVFQSASHHLLWRCRHTCGGRRRR